MPNTLFKLSGRDVTPDGIRLFLTHKDCGKEVALFLANKDELKSRYPIRCPCGGESYLYFGNPKFGRRLIELLKKPSPGDRPGEITGPQLN